MIGVLKKTIVIFLLASMIISCVYVISNASNDAWSEKIMKETENEEDSKIATSVKNILDIIAISTRIIGVAVAIIMLITLGAKYMMAAPGDRADIKKSAIPFVVGAFILFSVSGILSIILKFSDNINS